MKKIIALLLALTMVLPLIFSGCGQKAESNGDSSTAAIEQPTATEEPIATPKSEFMVPEGNHQTIAVGLKHSVAVRADGTVYAVGGNQEDGQIEVYDWTDIVAVDARNYRTLGLRSDGTVVATGDSRSTSVYGIDEWAEIVEVSVGSNHTVGLRANGTVVAVGASSARDVGACDVEDWTDIVAISAGGSHTLGLRSDGIIMVIYK
ncbi:hypothetical protein [Sharpea azabuensis]|uniref:Regulator of chromosome condensation (RCC1) repeat-containing protein n=1 Tax=Sharpea azabuensis TaxID=322505 RepID=A0A1H6Y0E4_9FIRM|nr:hypothetical protein [Sharpea azabuensis]SEJ30275.1 Regulator of chromosome condensation (RCC1) repeat-containing protein [Sharpea azabuensis]